MALSPHNHSSLRGATVPVADILLVRIPQGTIARLQSNLCSCADSGREALEMLKLFHFRLLVASLDVPDMPAWELFQRARRAQARLQCVLLDERMTPEVERLVRQAGAGAFVAIDQALCAILVRPSLRG
jgi:CheY-like chemotaxis protein